MSIPSYTEFLPWITEALEEANPEKMKVRFRIAFPWHFVNHVLEKGDWKSNIPYLGGPFYELYVQYSRDNSVIENLRVLKVHQAFWKFVRTSEKLMALPFFQKLYPKQVIAKKDPEKYPAVAAALQEGFGTRYSVLLDSKITPEIFYESTYKELKFILSQTPSPFFIGEQLFLLKLWRKFNH